MADDMSLKSISGYRQIAWKIGTDLDGTPETLQEVTDHQHQWQVSQEFQLHGKALDDNLNYVTGLYYFEEAGYVHDYVPFESCCTSTTSRTTRTTRTSRIRPRATTS